MISNDQLHLGWMRMHLAELLCEAEHHRFAEQVRRARAAESVRHRRSAAHVDPCESC